MILIDIDKQSQNGTTIFNILDNTTELWMTKYIIGEIFSSGRATLYNNPSDQTVMMGCNKKNITRNCWKMVYYSKSPIHEIEILF